MERGQERFSEQSKCGTYIDSGWNLNWFVFKYYFKINAV